MSVFDDRPRNYATNLYGYLTPRVDEAGAVVQKLQKLLQDVIASGKHEVRRLRCCTLLSLDC